MAFITTVIPVYNAEKFLQETLDSVAAQTRRPDRLVILDNCSTDETPKIIEQFRKLYPGISEWKRNEKNIGGLANFNRALDYSAETDILHIFSADDLIKPNFFERLAPTIEDVRGHALAHTLIQQINEAGTLLPPFLSEKNRRPVQLTQQLFLKRQADLQHIYCQSVLLGTARKPPPVYFRVDWVQAADVIFYSEWATFCEKIVVLPEPLCLYRVHGHSATGGNVRNLDAWVMQEWKAMQFIEKINPSPGLHNWAAAHRRKVIFGGRSIDKMRLVQNSHPLYARQIRDAVVSTIGFPHWLLSHLAIRVRDILRKVQIRRRSSREK